MLLFNLYWYGAFLSFPVLGEDAGALLSNLLETIKDGHLATTRFPINWLEGLGQPNLFVTFTFDPFAWVMLLPLEPADSFRLSMALRATRGMAHAATGSSSCCSAAGAAWRCSRRRSIS